MSRLLNIKILLIGLLILLCFNTTAQPSKPIFEHITQKNGLSHSSVYSIFQDKKGFVWLGTRDGLNRFDGYNFKVFRYSVSDSFSISSNEILSITDDTLHNLWIGTQGGGLNIYDPIHERFYKFQAQNNSTGLRSNIIHQVFRDRSGTMWLATKAGLYKTVLKKNPKNEFDIDLIEVSREQKFSNGKEMAIRYICETRNRNLMLATDNGLYIYNPELSAFKEIIVPETFMNMYTCMVQESANVFWLGSFANGLYRITFKLDEEGEILDYKFFISAKQGYYNLPIDRIEALKIEDDILWVATRNGLVCINTKTGEKKVYQNNPLDEKSIGDNMLNCLHADRSGNMWIGSEYQGISKIDLCRKPFLHLKNIPGNSNSLCNNYVTCITSAPDGSLFVGTDGGGIDKIVNWNSENPKFINYNQSRLQVYSNYIISLLRDNDDQLWIGSNLNFYGKLNLKNNAITYTNIDGYIFGLCEGAENRIWMGTWLYGLYMLDKTTGKYVNFIHDENNPNSLSIDIAISVFEDKNKTLWVGTKGGGLNIIKHADYIQGKQNFIKYLHHPTDINSISNNDIKCIKQDSKGNIWLGTANGLNRAIIKKDGTISFKAYFEADGLPNSDIYGILEDNKGNLWISTNKGLSRFDPINSTFRNFDETDGLQSDAFRHNAYYKDNKGFMFFGGINGLTIFNPDSIGSNPYAPEVAITNIKLFGKEITAAKNNGNADLIYESVSMAKEIELSYKDKEISIEFAALHYSAPQKNQYKYRLKGFNNKWQMVSADNRIATYTNLDDGTYVFEVLASNNDGLWTSQPATLKIKILPPLWRTIWAYMLYFVILLGALLLFRRYTLIAITEKNKLVLEHLEREKIEELSQLKIQFFTNISHELRTPLTLITSPLEDLLAHKAADNYTKQQLTLMQRNVNRLLHMVNQLLDFKKIDAGQLNLCVSEISLNSLINEVNESFKQHASARNIHFTYNAGNCENIFVDKEKIKTVLYNLLSNAFKFTPDNGIIKIELESCEKENIQNKRLRKLLKSKGIHLTRFAKITVSDTGVGIDKKQINKIFDRFYQADNNTPSTGGSGIGLAISNDYAEMHGGAIEVKSALGQGSTFSVYLPLGKEHLEIFHATISEEAITTQEIEHYQTADNEAVIKSKSDKPRILIVDDSLELTDYLGDRLNDTYELIIANNGVKGYQMAIESNPDLVITDLMMPEMDGYELCKKLKVEIQTSHIPIIILSAKATEESTVKGLETGADVYISKPFSVNILKAQIKTLLESKQKLQSNFNRELILQPKDVTVTSIDERFMKKLIDVVEENIANPNFGIKEMTLQMNMSHSVIFRKIKSLSGLNVVEFIRSFRLKKAALILSKNKLPIAEVSYMVGFSDPKYFSKCFTKEFGVTPSEYASKH